VADDVMRHAPGPVLLVRAPADNVPHPHRGHAAAAQSAPANAMITSEGV
jgi:hypothetical protein